jgi:hypothetical protein
VVRLAQLAGLGHNMKKWVEDYSPLWIMCICVIIRRSIEYLLIIGYMIIIGRVTQRALARGYHAHEVEHGSYARLQSWS